MKVCDRGIKDRITKILVQIGIPANLQGFGYFRECIYFVIKEPTILKSVTKILYPQVGELFNVNGSAVERCMRHASDVAYDKTKFKRINELFGIINNEETCYKPTNSEIIALIAEFLRMEMVVA